MGEKPTVAFRVEADTKAEWSDAVEQSDEYASLSHLIKKAVNRELLTDGPPESGETGDSQQIGELIDSVNTLQGRLDTLEGAVTDATRSMNASSGLDQETTTEVFKALPTAPERATTAEGIAEGLSIDSDTARLALESIADTAAVRKREIQEIEEGGGMTTITDHQGRSLEIENPGTAIKRRNPLWYRED